MAPARENAGAASRRACASVPATVTAWLREAGPRPVRPDARPRPLADPARAAMLRDMSAAVRNSIGMLLAHIAIVEVFWTRLALEDRPMPFEVHDVLGMGLDDDGMPLKADA